MADSRRSAKSALPRDSKRLNSAVVITGGDESGEHSEDYRKEYNRRAGVEGTISQGVRAFGLRRARYIGAAKVGLEHALTAAGMNLVRIADWLAEQGPAKPRRSSFARVMAAAAA